MTTSDSKLQSFTLAESILENIESCERKMSAVSVDDNTLQQWLAGKLWKMNEVRNVVQRFLTNMSGEVIAKAWAANQKKIWKDLNALAHVSWKGVAAPAARVRSTSGVPLYSPAGRIFNPILCLDLSLHYIKVGDRRSRCNAIGFLALPRTRKPMV